MFFITIKANFSLYIVNNKQKFNNMKIESIKPYLKVLNLSDSRMEEICQLLLSDPIGTMLKLAELEFKNKK